MVRNELSRRHYIAVAATGISGLAGCSGGANSGESTESTETTGTTAQGSTATGGAGQETTATNEGGVSLSPSFTHPLVTPGQTGDAGRTELQVVENVEKDNGRLAEPTWSVDFPEEPRFTALTQFPLIANNRVYGSAQVEDGESAQNRAFVYQPGAAASDVTVYDGYLLSLSPDGSLMFRAVDGQVVATDAVTGDRQWTVDNFDPSRHDFVATADHAVVGGSPLRAVEPETGEILWTSSSVRETGRLVADTELIIHATESQVTAFDSAGGGVRWTRELDVDPFGQLVLGNQIVIPQPAGTRRPAIVAFDRDGGRLWRRDFATGEGERESIPAIATTANRIVVAVNGIGSRGILVSAHDRSDGSRVWKNAFARGRPSRIIRVSDGFYVRGTESLSFVSADGSAATGVYAFNEPTVFGFADGYLIGQTLSRGFGFTRA